MTPSNRTNTVLQQQKYKDWLSWRRQGAGKPAKRAVRVRAKVANPHSIRGFLIYSVFETVSAPRNGMSCS